MKSIITVYVVIVALMGGCDNPPDQPLKGSLDKDPLWESEPLSHLDKPGIDFTTPHYVEIMPIYNNTVLTGYTDSENKLRFIGLDITTGKTVWKSSYYTERITQAVNMCYSAQRDNLFYFYGRENVYDQQGNVLSSYTPFYGYDISNGALVTHKIYDQYFGGSVALMRLKNDVMVSLEQRHINEEGGFEEPYFWITQIPDFDHRTSLKVPMINEFLYAYSPKSRGEVLDFDLIERDGELFLVYVAHEPKFQDAPDIDKANTNYHINCYNVTRQEWVYMNKPCNGGGLLIATDGDTILFGQPGTAGFGSIDAGVRAYNWLTGDLIWYLPEADFQLSSQVSLAYNGYDPTTKTIVTNEVGSVVGIDAVAGKIKWKSDGIGSQTSNVLIHNGVAYTVGAYVHGIDVATGEHLMAASFPAERREMEGQQQPGFLGLIGMHVQPNGKPIIIARNYMFAYAFEGVR